MSTKKKLELESAVLLDFDILDNELILIDNTDSEEFVLEMPDPIEALTNEIDSDIRARSRVQNRRDSDSAKVVPIDFGDRTCTTRRASSSIESRMDSALADLIGQRIKTKALPLALRKRLMYQRAVST